MDQQLTFGDIHYFDECLRDQNALLNPAVIYRTISIAADPSYPDNPPIVSHRKIKTKMDVREVALAEIVNSAGLLLTGDLVCWSKEKLYGPGDGDADNPTASADIVFILGHEYVVTGFPSPGHVMDTMPLGYQAYLRRRKGVGSVAADSE